jgi:hypothetical protein
VGKPYAKVPSRLYIADKPHKAFNTQQSRTGSIELELVTASSDNLTETRSGDDDDDKSQDNSMVFLSPCWKHTMRKSSCSSKTTDTVESPLKDNPFGSLSLRMITMR